MDAIHYVVEDVDCRGREGDLLEVKPLLAFLAIEHAWFAGIGEQLVH